MKRSPSPNLANIDWGKIFNESDEEFQGRVPEAAAKAPGGESSSNKDSSDKSQGSYQRSGKPLANLKENSIEPPSKRKRSGVTNEEPAAMPPSLEELATRTGPPKRPTSSYNIFFREERPKLIAFWRQDDDDVTCLNTPSKLPTFDVIQKMLGKRWRTLSQPDKQRYEELANQDQQRFLRELQEYEDAQAAKKYTSTTNVASVPPFRVPSPMSLPASVATAPPASVRLRQSVASAPASYVPAHDSANLYDVPTAQDERPWHPQQGTNELTAPLAWPPQPYYNPYPPPYFSFFFSTLPEPTPLPDYHHPAPHPPYPPYAIQPVPLLASPQRQQQQPSEPSLTLSPGTELSIPTPGGETETYKVRYAMHSMTEQDYARLLDQLDVVPPVSREENSNGEAGGGDDPEE